MFGADRSENMEEGGSNTVDGVRQLHYIPINISVHQPKNRNLRGDTNANDLELRLGPTGSGEILKIHDRVRF